MGRYVVKYRNAAGGDSLSETFDDLAEAKLFCESLRGYADSARVEDLAPDDGGEPRTVHPPPK